MSSQLSYLTFTTRSRHSHVRHPLHSWVHHCVVTPTLPGQLNLRQIWNFNMNWSYTWAKYKMNWTHTWGVFKPQQCNRCCVESQEATRLLASTFGMAMMMMMMVRIVMVKTPPLTWKVREKQWWWWWDFKIMANAKNIIHDMACQRITISMMQVVMEEQIQRHCKNCEWCPGHRWKGKYLGILYETWESQSQICLLPLDRSCVDPSLAEPSCSLPPKDNKFLNISCQGR